MGNLTRGWRALALAFCTLWGNMLLIDSPGGSALSAPFASRVASMAFSIVGFVVAFAVARRRAGTPVRERRKLLAGATVLACLGSFLHFCHLAWVPGWADVTSVALFSVSFAFPLIACGEVYASMEARPAIVYAGLSYFLAWLGCSLVGGMSQTLVCTVACALPLLTCAFVAAPAAGSAAQAEGCPAADASKAGSAGPHDPSRPAAGSAADALRSTLAAIPLRVLAALAITYFALGATWAQSGTPQDYFQPGMVLAAALTSLVVMAVCLALHGRVSLTGLYKVLMVGQVLAAFLLSEWAAAAQLALVITLVGVKIVAWTLMAELAHSSQERGGAPAALVYALGCLAGHVGEGVAGVLGVFGVVSGGPLMIAVVLMLVMAAAFLFTGPAKTPGDAPAAPAQPAAGDAGAGSSAPHTPTPSPADAAAALDAHISELARSFLLSERETDVFRLWATGHTLKYVQDKLGLSASTVKTHVRHIYDKTGLHSRAEVVALLDDAREEGTGTRDRR